ncbi:hypothetical protein [Aestuariivirga sp.]|uniref:hypothetical protein n=1 Tax=Aestuariivirga sp. TaxID=2650926 RepID=UPI0039E61543
MRKIVLFTLIAASLSIAGCSSINKLTGQTDDTILPGQREDAIPGKPVFPAPGEARQIDQPGGGTVTANQNIGCADDDTACKNGTGGGDSSPQQ